MLDRNFTMRALHNPHVFWVVPSLRRVIELLPVSMFVVELDICCVLWNK